MISEEYKVLNQRLFNDNKHYGANSPLKAYLIQDHILSKYDVNTILDYGCGRGYLKNVLLKYKPDYQITNYDPCFPDFMTRPEKDSKFDLVVCSDVLEHIEPEHIDAVLSDISSFTGKFLFVSIGLDRSNKTLADGRNAHILIKPREWWQEKLEEHGFNLMDTIELEYRKKEGVRTKQRLVGWTALFSKEDKNNAN